MEKHTHFLNAVAGKDYVLKTLKLQGYKWKNIVPINKGRYWLVEGANNPNICIIYKSEWFLMFGKFAEKNNWADEKGNIQTGLGDTINKEDLKTMLSNDVKKVIILYDPVGVTNKYIYEIELHKFLCESFSWINKECKEVRSISIHKYRKLEEVE